MAHSRIAAVLFDWDFTLARVLGNVSASERIAFLLQREGLKYSASDIQAAVDQRNDFIRSGKMRGTLEPQTHRTVVQFYQQLLDLLGSDKAQGTFADHLYHQFGRLPISMYEDALATLRLLAQQGLPLGIISNNARTARATIERAVGDVIQPGRIVISEEIGVHKPRRTIFRYATSRIKTPANLCMYVGDNLKVDAIGAVQYGGYGLGLWIDRKGLKPEPALPKHVKRITALHEVTDYVSEGK